jgi:hypothetical protein
MLPYQYQADGQCHNRKPRSEERGFLLGVWRFYQLPERSTRGRPSGRSI